MIHFMLNWSGSVTKYTYRTKYVYRHVTFGISFRDDLFVFILMLLFLDIKLYKVSKPSEIIS